MKNLHFTTEGFVPCIKLGGSDECSEAWCGMGIESSETFCCSGCPEGNGIAAVIFNCWLDVVGEPQRDGLFFRIPPHNLVVLDCSAWTIFWILNIFLNSYSYNSQSNYSLNYKK